MKNPSFLVIDVKDSGLTLLMEEQKSSSNMSEIDIASCAINSVTVYKDRAEVQRSLAFSPQRFFVGRT